MKFFDVPPSRYGAGSAPGLGNTLVNGMGSLAL